MFEFIPVAERLPEQGQHVVGVSNNGGTWTEVWDKDEPIGCMRYWFPIPPLPDA